MQPFSCCRAAPDFPNEFAIHDKRQIPLMGRHGTREGGDHSPTTGQGILKGFRGLLIVHGALGLLDRHLDATDLRVIQSLTVDEVSPSSTMAITTVHLFLTTSSSAEAASFFATPRLRAFFAMRCERRRPHHSGGIQATLGSSRCGRTQP